MGGDVSHVDEQGVSTARLTVREYAASMAREVFISMESADEKVRR